DRGAAAVRSRRTPRAAITPGRGARQYATPLAVAALLRGDGCADLRVIGDGQRQADRLPRDDRRPTPVGVALAVGDAGDAGAPLSPRGAAQLARV
ncbi:MAG: hypothetical protein AVDCRST_MAG18-4003, partial [uncultured Thermomicrobiales bacterium]